MSEPLDVVVAGAGFAGLGLAQKLMARRARFAVLEQATGVGGVWRDNHYPGAACDIESHLYSLSFAPNAEWTRLYAPQREILAYLETQAAKVAPHLQRGVGVRSARFDEASARWHILLTDGRTLHARALVSAAGHGLTRPIVPSLEGATDFAGAQFHSARWNHEVRLDGKRIGVVGTGASAIQIVPAVAPRARQVTVFQRSPAWIVPRSDRAISPPARWLFRRVPAAQRALRAAMFARHELVGVAMAHFPRTLKVVERETRAYLAREIGDAALRRALTPSYAAGCKRILLSDDFYAAMARANVTLVTAPLARATRAGVVTADGQAHPLDVVVYATGFEAADGAPPFELEGRSGRTWSSTWRESPGAYRGTTMHGFPNFFMLVGPNTGLGHNSMIAMMEAQYPYILGALAKLEGGVRSLEVRAEEQARYEAWLTDRFEGTVWASGCRSWYISRAGRNTVVWPGTVSEYRWRMRRFDDASYDVT